MNSIRTTIAFDSDLHQQLSLQAVQMGMGLGELVNQRLKNVNFGQTNHQTNEKINGDVVFFRSLGKKLGKTDWVKIIREERDRDRG